MQKTCIPRPEALPSFGRQMLTWVATIKTWTGDEFLQMCYMKSCSISYSLFGPVLRLGSSRCAMHHAPMTGLKQVKTVGNFGSSCLPRVSVRNLPKKRAPQAKPPHLKSEYSSSLVMMFFWWTLSNYSRAVSCVCRR